MSTVPFDSHKLWVVKCNAVKIKAFAWFVVQHPYIASVWQGQLDDIINGYSLVPFHLFLM